jgi:hypothetical protein
MRRRLLLLLSLVTVCRPPLAAAADLQPRTAEAFERYQRLTEARLDAPGPFLWVDTLAEPLRKTKRDELHRGGLLIERLTTQDMGKPIEIPGGLVHHWLGTVFVAGATADQAVALLQAYDRHAQIYTPVIARSRLLGRDGDTFRPFLRFRTKKIITVVVNSEHVAKFTRPGRDRVDGRLRSTRIAQVENPDTPEERELPPGRDDGYLWRLNTYWRLLEADGGVYVQCESISLTRSIPAAFGWLIGPFVTSVPRESLTFTLETTRNYLARLAGSRGAQ